MVPRLIVFLLLLSHGGPGLMAQAATINVPRVERDESALFDAEKVPLSADEGLGILGAALEARRRRVPAGADCSHLVHTIYESAGFPYTYSNSIELYQGVEAFEAVTAPQPGDLVVWRGHVGILISPMQRTFFSALRSGRGVEVYDSPYWKKRGRPRFFRYLKGNEQVAHGEMERDHGAN